MDDLICRLNSQAVCDGMENGTIRFLWLSLNAFAYAEAETIAAHFSRPFESEIEALRPQQWMWIFLISITHVIAGRLRRPYRHRRDSRNSPRLVERSGPPRGIPLAS